MHLPLRCLHPLILPTTLLILLLSPPSHPLTLPPLATLSHPNTTTTTTTPQTPPPAIGQPICRRHPGGFSLLLCARLLTNLKNLPDYKKQEIYSEYATGAYRLPVVFVQTDPVTARTCHLTMDLYGPAAGASAATASETFSLEGEQRDLNGIYFDCLKKYGRAGFARIGLHGYVAALLGPPLEAVLEGEGGFEGLVAVRNGSRGARVVDLTELGGS